MDTIVPYSCKEERMTMATSVIRQNGEGEQLARRFDESFTGARLLLCSAGQLIWD